MSMAASFTAPWYRCRFRISALLIKNRQNKECLGRAGSLSSRAKADLLSALDGTPQAMLCDKTEGSSALNSGVPKYPRSVTKASRRQSRCGSREHPVHSPGNLIRTEFSNSLAASAVNRLPVPDSADDPRMIFPHRSMPSKPSSACSKPTGNKRTTPLRVPRLCPEERRNRGQKESCTPMTSHFAASTAAGYEWSAPRLQPGISVQEASHLQYRRGHAVP